MKVESALLAATLVAFTAVVPVVFAAEERSAEVGAGPAATAKTGADDAKKVENKKVKPHRHPVEKGVMPPSYSPEPKASGEKPKKPIHDHRRDMKGG